jgi:alanine-synthesizing transaminase
VVDKLVRDRRQAAHDRYSASKGIAGLRRAQAGYYERRFGVKLNPTPRSCDAGLQGGLRQHGPGHHGAGRRGAGPNPSYPDPRLRLPDGGRRHSARSAEPTPGLLRRGRKAWRTRSRSRSRSWSANPSNPTAYTARLDFYRDLVAFAKKHELILLSDLAYSEVYFDDNPPPSVLQVPAPWT